MGICVQTDFLYINMFFKLCLIIVISRSFFSISPYRCCEFIGVFICISPIIIFVKSFYMKIRNCFAIYCWLVIKITAIISTCFRFEYINAYIAYPLPVIRTDDRTLYRPRLQPGRRAHVKRNLHLVQPFGYTCPRTAVRCQFVLRATDGGKHEGQIQY